MNDPKKRIVIVGGGFGGVYVARKLASRARRGEISLTIVSKTNHFVFTPLLHEVATGGLSPASVTEPLRAIFPPNVAQIVEGTARLIDLSSRKVFVGDKEISFDRIVVATGSAPNYYGVPGAREFGLTLGSVGDALRIRDRVISAFGEAEGKGSVRIVVVGGGATGIELAAEIHEFSNQLSAEYYSGVNAELTVLSSSSDILPRFSPATRRIAAERLAKKGMRIVCDAAVSSIVPGKVLCSDGSEYVADIVVWAAGTEPSVPEIVGGTVSYEKGRILVDEYLRCAGTENAFALGDAAGAFPMLAQVAVRESEIVAKNIIASLEGAPLHPFSFRPKGMLLSLGKWYAAGEVYSIGVRGYFAWWLWRTVYLFKFSSWKKRLRIVFEWSLHAFSPRDITRTTDSS